MVKVLTSRHIYSGTDRVDTAVKSSTGPGDCLVPSWRLVAGHKLHTALQTGNEQEIERWKTSKFTGLPTEALTDDQYTTEYLKLLRQRYAENKQPFLDLLTRDSVTLTCYCAAGQFCHRHIAIDVLEKVAAHHQIPFERGGEVDPKTGRQWIAPNDSRYQAVEFGVVPIRNIEERIGYAAVARESNARRLNHVLELGHFRTQEAAATYLDDVKQDVQQANLPLTGSKEEVRETKAFLSDKSWERGVRDHWSLQTVAENKAWAAGEYAVQHAPEDLKLDPDYQEIRFGIIPIHTPGDWKIGVAAAALVSQGDKHALVELAHFAPTAGARANQYLDEVEEDLVQRKVALAGSPHKLDQAVYALEYEARQSGLSGVWTALTPDQVSCLESKQFVLTHPHYAVRLRSDSAWTQGLELDMA